MNAKDFPKFVRIKEDVFYEVKFRRKMPKPSTVGYCHSGTQEISIAMGLDKELRLKTFIHELLHCIEFEYDIKIPHKLIYALEDPLIYVLSENTNLQFVKWE